VLPGFHLDVVGDGPERSALEALRRSLGLESSVSLLGERRDVARLLGDADLFALASTSEGLSVSILEALDSGLPSVVTNVGGNPEIVQHGTTGWLVPSASPEALAVALKALLEDPQALTAMGRAARLRAEQHFDLRGVVARYVSLYLDLLATRRRAS
jgi:glycosyltransferase involved in cell wall biosynthesis